MTSSGRKPSPLSEIPRSALWAAAFLTVVVLAVVAALVATRAEGDAQTGPSVQVARHPLVPWTVVGTTDEGRSVVVLPIVERGACDGWVARVLDERASGPVRLEVRAKRVRCSEADAVNAVAGRVTVPLRAALDGRSISGREMRSSSPLVDEPVRLSALLPFSKIRVPGVVGMDGTLARQVLAAGGFKARFRGPATGVVAAQRPESDAAVPLERDPQSPAMRASAGTSSPSFLDKPATARSQVTLTTR